MLKEVASLYNKEREEFYQKYRIFQLHKWEILRVVKQRMLAQKIENVKRAKQLKLIIAYATLRSALKRCWEVFDRERFMIEHRRKMFPVITRIRIKLRKAVFHYGRQIKERHRKRDLRDTNMVLFGGHMRTLLRERAKMLIADFLEESLRR